MSDEMATSALTTGSTRRGVLAGAAALATIPPFGRVASAQSVIKIGVSLPKQGPQTEQGSFIAGGIQIALDQAGGKLLGQTCQTVWSDEPNAQGAQQNMQKLIDEEKLVGVIGGGNSATALALGAVAKRARVPLVIVNAAARELTGKSCNRYSFSCQTPVPVTCRAMAPYLLQRGKKWYFLTANYAFGQDIANSFRELLKAAGGTEVGSDQTPLGTTDYSSFVLKIRQARPDVVIAGVPGDDLSNFLKQYAEIGLKGRIPVACPIIGDSDIEAVGTAAATGIYGKPWDRQDPMNSAKEKEFATAFQARYGKTANDKAFLGWIGMTMLLGGIEAAKSTDPAKIVTALETFQVGDMAIPAHFRTWDHQLLHRWLVVGVKDKVTDPRDFFDILESVPKTADGLDALYGAQADIGCTIGDL